MLLSPNITFGDQLYSTYLGGNDYDWGYAIAVDAASNVYVTGGTNSTTFPTLNSFQSSNAGGRSAFVTKINKDGSVLIYSTYLGGSGYDLSLGIAVSGDGRAYVTGLTDSADFPVVDPIKATRVGYPDVFITQFSPAGNTVEFSTYLGGDSENAGNAIQLDSRSNIYVTGFTYSDDFPTEGAPYQPHNAGMEDAFVVKIAPTATRDTVRGLRFFEKV